MHFKLRCECFLDTSFRTLLQNIADDYLLALEVPILEAFWGI
jgi:hypothetical protein